jgi:hypothetical protein
MRTSIVLLAVMMLATVTSHAQNKKAPRLVADNRTAFVVEVYSWDGAKWNFVNRVAPHSWQQFPNVPQGSYWRAIFGKAIREHRVKYSYHADYAGYQDVWLIH